MRTVRIFISYVPTDDPSGEEMARRLMADLQAAGAEVVSAPEQLSNRAFLAFLTQELPSCHHVLFIQTPTTLRATRVRTTLQIARRVLDQQRLVRFIATSSDSEELPSLWEALHAFDASQDYPRQRERLLLEVGLSPLNKETGMLFSDGWVFSSQVNNPANVPAHSRTPLLHPENHTTVDLPPVQEFPLDRPLPARRWFFLRLLTHWFALVSEFFTPPHVREMVHIPTRRPRRSPVPEQTPPKRRVPQFAHTHHPGSASSRLGFFSQQTFLLAVFLLTVLLLAGGLFAAGRVAASHTASNSVRLPATRLSPFPTIASLPTEPQTLVFVQDSFQRPDQQGWGTSSDGHLWGADATNPAHFSIQQGQGIIANGQGAFNATVGQPLTNAEIVLTGSISLFANTNMGAILRWVNPTTFYKAYLDGQQLVLLKRTGNHQITLASVAFPATANTRYNLRFLAQGTMLAARAWPADTPEPKQWIITAQDSAIQSGVGGVRAVIVPGATVTITSFEESLPEN